MATFRRIYETAGLVLEHLDMAKLESIRTASSSSGTPPTPEDYDSFLFSNLGCRNPEDKEDYDDDFDLASDHHKYLPYIQVLKRTAGGIKEVNRIFVHYIPVILAEAEKSAPCVATEDEDVLFLEVLGDPGPEMPAAFAEDFKAGNVTVEDYYELISEEG